MFSIENCRNGGPGRTRTCNQTVMSDGISISFVDFPAVLFAFDRVCCVSLARFLVRNWCGCPVLGSEDGPSHLGPISPQSAKPRRVPILTLRKQAKPPVFRVTRERFDATKCIDVRRQIDVLNNDDLPKRGDGKDVRRETPSKTYFVEPSRRRSVGYRPNRIAVGQQRRIQNHEPRMRQISLSAEHGRATPPVGSYTRPWY